jgi:ADP-heptose:LPS heptosyltransferase
MGVFDNFPGIHARRARSDRFEKLTSVAWLWTTARFDLAILDNSRRRAKVARWGGIRRVVGVREKDDETWLTASVRWQESGHDLFDPLRGVLGLLGADPDVRPCLYPGDDARAAATQALASLPSRPAVGLFVDAGREIKCWPIERFVELGERLERAGFGVVAISGVGGHTLVEPVKARGLRTVEALPHPLVLAEFIRGLAVLVTNDSGPAHLADAVGTPATILYGPTTPVRFAPHGSQHRLLHAGLGCDFYLGRCEGEAATGTCDRRCMRAITVDQVFEAATALART